MPVCPVAPRGLPPTPHISALRCRRAICAAGARGAVVALRRVGPVSRFAVPALQWARVSADLNLRLRRGAWHRVLELHPLEAVLDVRGGRVTVARPFLGIVGTPARPWTVLAGLRDAQHVPPARGR